MVGYLQRVYQVSEIRSCKTLKIHRSSYRYKPKKDEQAFLRMRIREIAATRVRYGYRRIHVLLLREGWKINHKRVYRLYREEGLNLRQKSKRRKLSSPRVIEKVIASQLNQCWATDFVSDQLFNETNFLVVQYLGTGHHRNP